MKTNVFTYSLLITCSILFLYSCEEVGDYYLGLNQQPEFTINTFEEGLNIFGLLRPDHLGYNDNYYNRSFVFVQQNWPSLDFNTFNIIYNTDITVYRLENGVIVDSVDFPLMPGDSLFRDTIYRPVVPFQPEAGQHYSVVCDHPDFPVAIGETIIPAQAKVDSSSVDYNVNSLEFKILPDPLIKMLDVYLVTISENQNSFTYAGRYVPDSISGTYITLSHSDTIKGVDIFSYDNNLATYYANSNTALNFNKYRTTFSTLESGFGVFGSMNLSGFFVAGQ